MITRSVKKIIVEYTTGEIETFEEEGMFHVSRVDFPRGATSPKQNFTSHDIRWIDPKTPYPEGSS